MKDALLLNLTSTFDGTAWHGTPLRTLVADLDEAKAHARPIAGARTIAELLAHLTAWIEIVEQRLRGEMLGEVPHEIDFPSVEGVAWSDQLARLDRAHARLVATVSGMSEEQLRATLPGKRYDAAFMLLGLVNHSTYHAAQIALLKK